jgi:hypothetical protein
LIKYIKYSTLVLLFNYGLTIGVHYLLRPLWFDGSEDHTNLTTCELFFTVAILPFSLITANYWLAKRFDTLKLLIVNAVTIYTCIFISSRLHFLNWADSIGSRTHPDGETLAVIAFETDVGLLTTTIGLILVFVRLYRKKKRLQLLNSDKPATNSGLASVGLDD